MSSDGGISSATGRLESFGAGAGAVASGSSMRDFKVVGCIGKGSYGAVYKCKRRLDGESYAVKEVNITKLNPREREDAVNEIRVLASVHHPNVIGYHDAFTERDNLYIVMEFAERGDICGKLKKYREANRFLREEVVWAYFIQMAQAVAHLHSRRIMHRDIKPKNVFLTSKDHIRIGDLGCSKVLKKDLARTQIGTPYYMSPEIWGNLAYGYSCDVWALGCVLFEMCALRPPFAGKDLPSLSSAVCRSATPAIPRHFSSELQGIVNTMLNKSAADRPSISSILALPQVQAHMHLLPDGHAPAQARAHAHTPLLDTIKFPKRVGRRLTLDLPTPSYPVTSRQRSESTENTAPRAGGAGGGAGGVTPSSCASDPTPKPKITDRSEPMFSRREPSVPAPGVLVPTAPASAQGRAQRPSLRQLLQQPPHVPAAPPASRTPSPAHAHAVAHPHSHPYAPPSSFAPARARSPGVGPSGRGMSPPHRTGGIAGPAHPVARRGSDAPAHAAAQQHRAHSPSYVPGATPVYAPAYVQLAHHGLPRPW